MHKRGNYIFIIALILVLSLSLVSAGWLEMFNKITGHTTDEEVETYYVSVSGSNSNSGTIDKPFKTIQKGVKALSAGDTLIIKSGTYSNEHITLYNSGTADKWITIKAEVPGTVILKGPSTIEGSSGEGLIIGSANKYFIIEGLEFREYDHGIVLDNTNYHILRNNTFRSNNMVGIQSWKSSNILVKECQFIDPNPASGPVNNAIQDYGVNFYYGENHTVINNYFWGNHNQAVSFKVGTNNGLVANNTFEGCLYSCVYLGQNDESTDLYCQNIIVESNVFRPAAYPYRLKNAIHVRNVKNAIVRDNFMEGMNSDSGSAVWIWNNKNGENASVYNNVIINSNQPGMRLYRINSTEIYHNTIINTQGTTMNSLPDGDNYMINNYNYTLNHASFSGPFDSMSWSSEPNPQFVPDFSRAYAFKLQPYSYLIDANKTNNGVTSDFRGVNRPQGIKSDIGAFEYKSVCNDGTINGACSFPKPKRCIGGDLIDSCQSCGCSSGYTCQSDGSCKVQTDCTPNVIQSCSTEKLGICTAGTKICNSQGKWENCIQNEQIINEICNDEKDNDCDGSSDCADSDCMQNPPCSAPLECNPIGFRSEGKYCSTNYELILQKYNGLECKENFECRSFFCHNQKCTRNFNIGEIIERFLSNII